MTETVRLRVGRFVVSEPMTLVTDYALAVVSAYFGVRLIRNGTSVQSLAMVLWGVAHLAIACGAATGGTYHGILSYLSQRSAARLWRTTVYLVGIANATLVSAAVVAETSGTVRTALLSLVVAKLIVYLIWMWSREDFRWVVYDTLVTLTLTAGLQTYALVANGSLASPWILAGIGVALLAATIQRLGLGINRYFNHNDVFHMVQIASMYLLYRGGLHLFDAVGASGLPLQYP